MTTKLRQHIKNNRQFYIGASAGVGLAGITWLMVRDPQSAKLPRGTDTVLPRGTVSPDQANTGAFIFTGNETVTIGDITTNIHNGTRGHPGFITRWIETGDTFMSQKAAAKEIGVTDSIMSGHLNGKLDDVHGQHFERVFPAA